MIITIDDLHRVPTWNGRQGYCHSQSRAFFKRHDLDWLDFVRNGIDADVLLKTGDALAVYLVEFVRGETDGW